MYLPAVPWSRTYLGARTHCGFGWKPFASGVQRPATWMTTTRRPMRSIFLMVSGVIHEGGAAQHTSEHPAMGAWTWLAAPGS